MRVDFNGIYTNSKFDTLDRCEKEYAHKYVLKTPTDIDYIDPNYFKFGRAFHWILEETEHDFHKFKSELLDNAIELNELDSIFDRAKLLKCLESYYNFQKKSDIKPLKIELSFKTENFGGIIDSIGVTSDKKWWIVDTKTAANLDLVLPYMLKTNQQLNLYAHFNESIKSQILDEFGIELQEFGGYIYRETKKPSERKTKKDIDFETFFNRLESVETRESKILASELNKKSIGSILARKKSKCEEVVKITLEDGIDALGGNTRNCINPIYKTVCKYFSTCHGVKYSELKELGDIDL